MTFLVKDSENCGNAWRDLWDNPGGLFDGDLGDWAGVHVVPSVTDVHVPVCSSSAVTESCEGISFRIGNLLNRSPLLSPRKGARLFGRTLKER